jgi:hypothetical protein
VIPAIFTKKELRHGCPRESDTVEIRTGHKVHFGGEAGHIVRLSGGLRADIGVKGEIHKDVPFDDERRIPYSWDFIE